MFALVTRSGSSLRNVSPKVQSSDARQEEPVKKCLTFKRFLGHMACLVVSVLTHTHKQLQLFESEAVDQEGIGMRDQPGSK